MKASSTSAGAARERLTVDLCGLKPALLQRASVRGVTLSVLVRAALAAEASVSSAGLGDRSSGRQRPGRRVRLSLRLGASEARTLTDAARATGLSLGAFVVELTTKGATTFSAGDRAEQLAALTRSNAELATISRSLAHLTALLRLGAGRAAQEYRGMLETLEVDVRAHLARVAALLPGAGKRPRDPFEER